MTATIAYLVLTASFVVVAVLVLRYERRVAAVVAENERLNERVTEVVAWLWAFTGQPMPEPAWTPPESSLVGRYLYEGQHRDPDRPVTAAPKVDTSGGSTRGTTSRPTPYKRGGSDA